MLPISPTESYVPEMDDLVGEWVEKQCANGKGNEIFLDHFGGKKVTFLEQHKINVSIASKLQNILLPKDNISFFIPDDADVFTFFLSVIKAGMVNIPINWRNVMREVEVILKHTQPKMFMLSDEKMEDAIWLDLDSCGIEYLVVYGEKDFDMVFEKMSLNTSRNPLKCSDFAGVLCGSKNEKDIKVFHYKVLTKEWVLDRGFHKPIADEHDLVAVLFTSGSTGKPKGVAHSHKSFYYCAWSIGVFAGLYMNDIEDIRCMHCAPTQHLGGLGHLVSSLLAGVTYHFTGLCGIEFFAAAVNEVKPTNLGALTAQFRLLLNSGLLKQEARECVRIGSTGGDIVNRDIKEAFINGFPNGVLHIGYGMTELCIISTNFLKDPENCSIGPVFADISLKIVDENGEEVPRGVVGELLYKTPYMFKEYYLSDEANAENFDAEGYLKSGDCARMDENGNLWFASRKKHVVKYKCFLIYISDIEEAVNSYPDVAEVGVVGKRDYEAGELPCAFVALKHTCKDKEEMKRQIQAFLLNGQLAEYRVPRKIYILDSLPKGKTGKVDRQLLKKMADNANEVVKDTFFHVDKNISPH